jgi:hypothetical protein
LHDMKRKLEGDSSIAMPTYVKDYFDEIKQNFAWIVQARLNKKTVYTLYFQNNDDNSRFLIWNDKVLFFKRPLELAQYVMSANSSSAASSPFARNKKAQRLLNAPRKDVQKADLEILYFDLEITKTLLQKKRWSKWTLEEIDFILNNLNMLTDFCDEDNAEFNAFLNLMTFIMISEIPRLENFDKSSIRKTVKRLTKKIVLESLLVTDL